MNLKAHWEQAYANRPPEQLGWYRPRLESSLALIAAVGLRKDQPLIDVGGGASTLVDDLLALGYERITVADLSDAALERARRRLGDRAEAVTWMSADMLTAELPAAAYDLWHDRAVFHFLTDAADRAAYLAQSAARARARRAGDLRRVRARGSAALQRARGAPVHAGGAAGGGRAGVRARGAAASSCTRPRAASRSVTSTAASGALEDE